MMPLRFEVAAASSRRCVFVRHQDDAARVYAELGLDAPKVLGA